MAKHDSTVTVHFKVDEDSTREFTDRLNAMVNAMACPAIPQRRYDQAIAAAERATALTEDVTARLEKMTEDRDALLRELTRLRKTARLDFERSLRDAERLRRVREVMAQ